MKIIVVGASGTIGRAVSEELRITGGGDDGVYFAGLRKQRLDALLRGDIHLIIPPGPLTSSGVCHENYRCRCQRHHWSRGQRRTEPET
jgi:nucleoside-diphosphate-sugar epimerase